MKFTCDSCNAQYMISDDKVGPAGVKVRCKKCGHVILVRKVARETADTKPSIAAPSGVASSANGATHPGVAAPVAGAPGAGLEAELGSAFDHAFGDTPPATAKPEAAGGAGADLGATQAMTQEDAEKVFAASAAPAPAATEWYVAIGQAQVGPLPLAEVKKKWEAGDVGPDSLVWRPGMGDWAPLTTVSELAGFLAPVPRAAPQGAVRAAAAEAAKAEPAPAPAAEVAWKPVGASALAALASEELASRAPEARPAPARPVKSLVDALPDGGGVDPTGALPLNIKALEPNTGERKIERRSSVARGAEKARRRSATRTLVAGVLAGVVLVAAAGGFAWYQGWIGPARAPSAAARIAAVPLPPPPAAAQPAPQAAQPAPQPAAPAPQPAIAAAAPPPAAAAPAPTARPEPRAEATPPHHAARPARAEPPPREPVRREPAKREAQRVAREAAPAPTPAAAKRGGDGLLDFDSAGNDSALDDALGGGPAPAGKRSVYVPPARAGGGGTLPDKVSPGEINGAVAQRMDALRKCVSDQKAREPDASGTLKMRWMILGDGSVKDVKCITPEYEKGQFAQCIGGVVRGIRFPKSSTTGQEVTFPFNF